MLVNLLRYFSANEPNISGNVSFDIRRPEEIMIYVKDADPQEHCILLRISSDIRRLVLLITEILNQFLTVLVCQTGMQKTRRRTELSATAVF